MVRRRALLGGLVAGLFFGTTGCVQVVAGCLQPRPETALSPEAVQGRLPEYNEPAANQDEHVNRVHEIQDALWEALQGQPWLVSLGQANDNGERILRLGASCPPRAERYVPDEWGGVTFTVERALPGGQAEHN